MGRLERLFFGLGAVSGATAVALGAIGAHALRAQVSSADLQIFETGVRYQMYHALALLAAASVLARSGSRLASAAGWLFVFGTVIFSGTLYLLTLSGARWLGAVTPLGGVALIAGWLCLALAATRS